MIDKVVKELIEGGYREETPVAVVYHASWDDEKIVRGTLKDIAEKVKKRELKNCTNNCWRGFKSKVLCIL